MGIGTSLGAYFDDAFHQSAAQWDPKYDMNEIGPDEAIQNNPAKVTQASVVSPNIPNPERLRPDQDNNIINPETGDWEALTRDHNELTTDSILDQGIRRTTHGPDPIQVDYKTASPLVTITDEDIDKGIGVAMAAGPGTMTGWTSKTADAAGRMKAAVMEGKGVPAEEIRQATGWFKGSDGRFRYEVSDDAMKLADRDWKFGETGKLHEFVEHPELFKAYPELKDINFKVAGKDDPFLGSYNRGTNTLTVNPQKIRAGDEGLLDVISHELQHAVQNREGFGGGSNPNLALKDALMATIKIKDKKEKGTLVRDIIENAKAFGDYMYQRTPGEVEANNVMARRKLTPEQRKQFSPQDTIDLLEGSTNSLTGGKYYQEFNYPKE